MLDMMILDNEADAGLLGVVVNHDNFLKLHGCNTGNVLFKFLLYQRSMVDRSLSWWQWVTKI